MKTFFASGGPPKHRTSFQRKTALALLIFLFLALWQKPSTVTAAVLERDGNTVQVKPLEGLGELFRKKPKATNQPTTESSSPVGAASQKQEPGSTFTLPKDEPPFYWAFMPDGYLLLNYSKFGPKSEAELGFQEGDLWPMAFQGNVKVYQVIFHNTFIERAIPLLLKSEHGDIRIRNSEAAYELLRLANATNASADSLERLILKYDPAFATASIAPRDEFARRDLVKSKLGAYSSAMDKARAIKRVRLYTSTKTPGNYDFQKGGFSVAFREALRDVFVFKQGTDRSAALDLGGNEAFLVPMSEADARELRGSGDDFTFCLEVLGELYSADNRSSPVVRTSNPREKLVINVASTKLYLLRVPAKAANPSLLRVTLIKTTTYPDVPPVILGGPK